MCSPRRSRRKSWICTAFGSGRFLERQTRSSGLHGDAVHSLAFSPDSRYLVSGSAAGDARIWDLEEHLSVARRGLQRDTVTRRRAKQCTRVSNRFGAA